MAAALPGAWSWDAEAVKGEIVTWERATADGVAHTICAFAPETYTPEKAWPLLLWLHGGVGARPGRGRRERREDVRGGGGEAGLPDPVALHAERRVLVGAERVALVRGALADMKRRYRVDADRVCVAGFSDGASGCYHLALHDPEPYACFLAFMGNPLVSRSMGGPTWSASLGHRPIYGVNGGVDQLYPSAAMQPFFEEMQAGGLRADVDRPPRGGALARVPRRGLGRGLRLLDGAPRGSPARRRSRGAPRAPRAKGATPGSRSWRWPRTRRRPRAWQAPAELALPDTPAAAPRLPHRRRVRGTRASASRTSRRARPPRTPGSRSAT